MKLLTVTLNPAIDVTLFTDGIDRDRANHVTREIRETGGKGINVSKMAKSFGVTAMTFGIAASDNADEFFASLGQRVGDYFFPRVRGRIRENITVRSGSECVKFNRPGFTVNSETITAISDVIEKQTEQGDLVAVSGSLPVGADENTLLDIARRVSEKGGRLLLDTESCGLEALKKIKPYFIKPNEHEFAALFGNRSMTEAEMISKLPELKAVGIENVFLTLGGDGMIAMLGDNIYRVRVPAIEVKSTVGAGDSTVSAFAIGRIGGYDDEKLLKFASACGTATTATEASGMATPDTYTEYFDKISVEKL